MPTTTRKKPKVSTSPENIEPAEQNQSTNPPASDAKQPEKLVNNRTLFSLVGILLVGGMIAVQLMIYLEVRNEGRFYNYSPQLAYLQVTVQKTSEITLRWEPVAGSAGYLVLRSEPSDTPLRPPATTALINDTFSSPYTSPRPASHQLDSRINPPDEEESIADLDAVSTVTALSAVTPYVLTNSDGSLIAASEFVDASVEPGQYFLYRVISFDEKGNTIAASRFLTAGIPLEEE